MQVRLGDLTRVGAGGGWGSPVQCLVCQWIDASVVFSVLVWVQEGNKRRKTEATDANAASSRSHAILEVTVCRSDKNHYRKQVQLLCYFQAAYLLEAKVMSICIITTASWNRSSILCCSNAHFLVHKSQCPLMGSGLGLAKTINFMPALSLGPNIYFMPATIWVCHVQ